MKISVLFTVIIGGCQTQDQNVSYQLTIQNIPTTHIPTAILEDLKCGLYLRLAVKLRRMLTQQNSKLFALDNEVMNLKLLSTCPVTVYVMVTQALTQKSRSDVLIIVGYVTGFFVLYSTIRPPQGLIQLQVN